MNYRDGLGLGTSDNNMQATVIVILPAGWFAKRTSTLPP